MPQLSVSVPPWIVEALAQLRRADEMSGPPRAVSQIVREALEEKLEPFRPADRKETETRVNRRLPVQGKAYFDSLLRD